jgi:hypothetical protein
LFVVDGKVTAFDQPLYGPKRYHPGSYSASDFRQVDSGKVVIRSTGGKVVRMASATHEGKPKSLWVSDRFERVAAMALGDNAVVVAGRLASSDSSDQSRYSLAAMGIENGRMLWRQPLPSIPASWAMALDGTSRIVVALQDGRVLCFAPSNHRAGAP